MTAKEILKLFLKVMGEEDCQLLLDRGKLIIYQDGKRYHLDKGMLRSDDNGSMHGFAPRYLSKMELEDNEEDEDKDDLSRRLMVAESKVQEFRRSLGLDGL